MSTFLSRFLPPLSAVVAMITLAVFSTVQWSTASAPGIVTRVPVVFAEGHDTDPVDRGRLVAGALGVAPEVFREAFSRVHPADPKVGPTGDEARQNKRVLMSALGRYGITNDRLDAVSNRYRYVRSRGETWPAREAQAVALVSDGMVTGFEITSGGYGYSSTPRISVPGVKDFACEVKLEHSKSFEHNGTVAGIALTAK